MKVSIKTTCPQCGKDHYVNVEQEDYEAYKNGELCQKAFPYLSADQREMLITGICKSCWKYLFGIQVNTKCMFRYYYKKYEKN